MNVLKFLIKVGKLKKIKRTGWIREGIKDPESVAEHSFRLIVLSMIFAPILKVNQEKLIKMAIVHDLGETEIGDLVVDRGGLKDLILRQKRENKEEKIIREMFKGLEEYSDLFKEIVERKTKESQILWELDKLETSVQAYEYEKEQKINLSEFIENAASYMKEPKLKEILEEIKKFRKEMWS